ncbi:MAG: peptidoglycan DD-metalloendopeptidase family protein [Saprospiraceae bacterium]
MRNILLTLTLTFVMTNLWGQTEKPNYKTIADKFEIFYNGEKPDSIFAMFSDEMQKALPIDKTTEFITGLNSQVGKIIKRHFIKYQTSYASYKTNFEKALFTVNISLNNNSKINGLFVKPYADDNLPKIERNETKLQLPFKGEWTVFWGGDTKELNYHFESQAQKNAFDIMITDSKGSTHITDGQANEDYYAFGKEIIAPCNGKIVLVVDGVKDNKIGEMNSFNIGGNMVILKTSKNEYLVFCHFKHQSIKVKEGEIIKTGQLLGLCGNSGHSSEPHLHFHIQNVEDMNVATGVKCYFDKLFVNGQVKTDYSPIKNDKIKAD